MMKFKNWDIQISKNYPKTWILGLHIYLPLLAFLYLLFYGLGWAYYTADMPGFHEIEDYSFGITQFSILPMFVIAILFSIRQVKFNSLRVHHQVPYKYPYRYFFAFFTVFLLITSIPIAVNFGLLHKLGGQIDEVKFIKDLPVLNKGYTHFYQSNFSSQIYDKDVPFKISVDEEGYETQTSRYIIVGTYRMDERIDSLIISRSYVHYAVSGSYIGDTSLRSYAKSGWDTIHLNDVLVQIEDFKKVAPFYEGDLDNPSIVGLEIIKTHYMHNAANGNLEERDQENFDLIKNNSRFKEVVDCYASIITKNGPLNTTKGSFWLYYITFPLSLSLLLFTICSVKITDFGWSLLVSALTGMILMLINGLFAISTNYGEEVQLVLNLFLVTFIIVLFLFMIISKKVKSTISKAFTISFQMFFFFLVFSYFGIFDALHDCPYMGIDRSELCKNYEYFESSNYYLFAYSLCVVLVLIGIGVFNGVYTRKYIHPKN